ncbi:4Fe-4S single cluster domain-containing protein [Nannocystis pusilla]|uniref:4Fe-4S single cluster domain-containing protein n=1 Tax=Nannocystis pusilla TaxID=889268 RepID=UPI003BF25655
MSEETPDARTDTAARARPGERAPAASETSNEQRSPRTVLLSESTGDCLSISSPRSPAMGGELQLRVAARVACTEAEGPGRRFAVWVQGCELRCPGCCNPELFARDGGESLAVAALADELRAARDVHAITGLTVLGGEPSEQAAAVAALCESARDLGLGTLVFTGRTHAELQAMPGAHALLAVADTLVDGRFDARRREPPDGRRWIGSTNQQIVHLTPRHADPALWRGRDHVELQIDAAGRITGHGAPDILRRVLRNMS